MSNPFGGIMSLFSGQSAAPQQPQQPQQPQKPQMDPNAVPALNQGNNSGDPKNPQQATGPKSPMDDYSQLFTLTEDERKAAAERGDGRIFNIDPAKLDESAKNLSFVKPEELQQHWNNALKGDSNALGELLNSVARAVYSRNATLSATLAEKAASSTSDNIRSELPTHFREFASAETIQGVNPAYNHPAAKPMVDALRKQFMSKYPNSSSTEIANMVNKYLDGFTQSLQAKDPKSQNGGGQSPAGDVNWQEFFTTGSIFGPQ